MGFKLLEKPLHKKFVLDLQQVQHFTEGTSAEWDPDDLAKARITKEWSGKVWKVNDQNAVYDGID